MKEAALICGGVGVLLNLLIYQQNTSKGILLIKLLSNVVWAVQYLLLGAYSGFCVACIGIARETTFISVDRKGRTGIICLSLFVMVAILCSSFPFFRRLRRLFRCSLFISQFLVFPESSHCRSPLVCVCMTSR